MTATNGDAQGEPGQGCRVEEFFQLLSKAHMLDVLYIFTSEADAPLRFGDIQDRLGISPNTLTSRLKDLVDHGFLTRTAYNEIPPRVEYEATAKAMDLCSVFDALQAWSERHSLDPEPAPERAAAKA